MLLSVALILLIGVVVIFLMGKLPLPGLLGLLLLGVALGPQGFNLLAAELIALGADLRLMALVIILLRAGLGLNRRVLNQVRSQALGLGILPCICEGVVVAATSYLILGFSWPAAFSLGFVLAAVSPAVVVPSMLWLKERGLGVNKGIPVMILAGASVDDVVAITFLTSALAWATGTVGAIGWQIALFPLRILGGIALGLGAGWLSLKLLPPINRLNKGYGVITVFALALLVVVAGEQLNVAGLLAVMALGFVLVEKSGRQGDAVVRGTDAAWMVAQIALFVLIGAAVNINVAWQAGAAGVLIVGLGLVGRSLGVLLGLRGSTLNAKERLFCIIAYLPKATVQAAVGGLPLAWGIAGGEVILAIAVLSIILTAPLGAALIPLMAPKLLEEDSPQAAGQ